LPECTPTFGGIGVHEGSGAWLARSIEMPTDLRLIQRRSQLRLDTVCPIEYTVVGQDEISGYGSTGEGMTRDISAGGLQCLMKRPARETVDVGAELELELVIGQDVVLAEGEVLRVEDATDLGPDGRRLPPAASPRPSRTWIAVQYVSISEGAQDRIVATSSRSSGCGERGRGRRCRGYSSAAR
jgi:PilZ domain